MVARFTGGEEVVGSSPAAPTSRNAASAIDAAFLFSSEANYERTKFNITKQNQIINLFAIILFFSLSFRVHAQEDTIKNILEIPPP